MGTLAKLTNVSVTLVVKPKVVESITNTAGCQVAPSALARARTGTGRIGELGPVPAVPSQDGAAARRRVSGVDADERDALLLLDPP